MVAWAISIAVLAAMTTATPAEPAPAAPPVQQPAAPRQPSPPQRQAYPLLEVVAVLASNSPVATQELPPPEDVAPPQPPQSLQPPQPAQPPQSLQPPQPPQPVDAPDADWPATPVISEKKALTPPPGSPAPHSPARTAPATTAPRASRVLTEDLEPVRLALADLDYSTFHKVNAQRVELVFNEESRISLTHGYTLYVTPISRERNGLIRLSVRLEMAPKQPGGRPLNAISTTLVTPPQKQFKLRGIKMGEANWWWSWP